MAKLWPQIGHCKYYMKCIILLNFYKALYYMLKIIACTIKWGFRKSGYT